MADDIAVNAGDNTDFAFENWEPFWACKTKTNDVFADKGNHIYIATFMYHLIEYSDNCSDTSGSQRQFKRDEVPANDVNLTTAGSDLNHLRIH